MARFLQIAHFLTLPVIAIGGLYLIIHGSMLFFVDSADVSSIAYRGIAIGLSILVSMFVARRVIVAKLKDRA